MSCLRSSSSSIAISSHLFFWESSRNHQLDLSFWIIFNDIDLKSCHHCVEEKPSFSTFRKSLLPFGTTDSVLPGSAGVEGHYHGSLRSRLVGWTPKKPSILPERLEEKKKAQAEKDQLPPSASVSLPIPDDSAPKDAHDVSPEVENQPDTGQAVISGGWRISGSSKRTLWIMIRFIWMKYITWKWYFRKGVLGKIALHFRLVMQDQIQFPS